MVYSDVLSPVDLLCWLHHASFSASRGNVLQDLYSTRQDIIVTHFGAIAIPFQDILMGFTFNFHHLLSYEEFTGNKTEFHSKYSH